jgi:Domain of unknown function (DUF4291)
MEQKMNIYEIRADYTSTSIIVYQAYSSAIAKPAIHEQRFVAPFSLNRMTWIKPSFLWMMERSNWGRKTGQEYILAIRISRQGWEDALRMGILTSYVPGVYRDHADWQAQFKQARVHIQWDPERSLQGKSQDYKSIQVGLSRHVIERYVDEWIQEIIDYTPLVRKLYHFIQSGEAGRAAKMLPKERVYPVDDVLAQRLGMR